MKKYTVWYTILVLVSLLCFILDNFLEMKVISIFGMSATLGFFVITGAYISGDAIVEVYGGRTAYTTIILIFVAYAVFSLVMGIACMIPAASYWEGEVHFLYIFKSSPKIMLCSIAAFICGNLTNAYIMVRMKSTPTLNKLGFRCRAMVSTVFGEYVDSLVFCIPVFYSTVPTKELLYMCLVWPIGKVLCELLVLPITERVIKYVDKKENLSYEVK